MACWTKGTEAGIGVEGGVGNIVAGAVSLLWSTVFLTSRFSNGCVGGFPGAVTGCLASSLGRGLASRIGERFVVRPKERKGGYGVSSNTCLRMIGPFSTSSGYDEVS